jgi:hypothetical protein
MALVSLSPPLIVLGIGFVAYFAWKRLPTMIHALGWSRYSSTTDLDPGRLDAGPSDPAYADILDKLRTAAFKPLGTIHECLWGAGSDWIRRADIRVFGSSRENCFVLVYGWLPAAPWGICLATVLPDEALLLTSAGPERLLRHQDFVRQQVPTEDLTELFQRHREAQGQFFPDARPANVHEDLFALASAGERHIWKDIDAERPDSIGRLKVLAQFTLFIFVPVEAAALIWWGPGLGLIWLCIFLVASLQE